MEAIADKEAAATLSELGAPWEAPQDMALPRQHVPGVTSLLASSEYRPTSSKTTYPRPSQSEASQSTTTSQRKRQTSYPAEPDDNLKTAKRSRKSPYVSRACAGCRRRKTKCDGATPNCTTCTLYKEDCVYDTSSDGRRPASKEYVASLQERVRALEAAIEELKDGGDDGNPGTAGGSVKRKAGGKFKIVRPGQVLAYGPTSSYMHLDSDTDRREGQNYAASSSAAYQAMDEDADLFAIHTALSIPEDSNWAEWLPAGVPKSLHDDLLNYFFAYVNPFTLFVDEPRFYRDLKAWSTKQSDNWSATAFYSPLLHNALLSVACKYTKDQRVQSNIFRLDANGMPVDRIPRKEAGLLFAQQATKFLEREWKAPYLSTVIGCMLLGTFHQVSAQPTLGWVYEGVGVRLANVLGLHMNSTDLAARGVISPELKRARDYCWATVAFQDKLWSYTHGRLPSIRSSDIENVSPPPISASVDAIPWYSYPRNMQLPGLRSTVLHYTAQLTSLAERIHTLNYSVQTLSQAQHELVRSQIRLELAEWQSNLPASCSVSTNATRNLQPHVINLNIAGWYLLVLLYRSHFREPSSDGSEENSPASICLVASRKVLNLLKLWRKQHGLDVAHPSLQNMTFCIGTIFVLAAANDEKNPKTNQSLFEDLDTTVAIIKEIGASSTFADLSGDALLQMKRDWLHVRDWTPASRESSESTAMFITELKNNQAAVTGIAQLNDPTSELSRALVSMGWKPPSTAAQEAAQLPSAQEDPNASGSWFSLDPADLALSLHPSFINIGFNGPDDQFASLYPQHLGGGK